MSKKKHILPVDDQGRKHGKYTIYWSTSRNIGTTIIYKHGVFHGLRTRNHPNGTLWFDTYYRNDKTFGTKIYYD